MKEAFTGREGYMVAQFPDMINLNKRFRQLYSAYFIDPAYMEELSLVDRSIIQEYWVDLDDPIHPSAYVIAGASTLPYVERLSVVYPYPTKKALKYDMSAYQKALINSQVFFEETKNMKKTKIVPAVDAIEVDEGFKTAALILRQDDMEATIPILNLPNRSKQKEQYHEMLDQLVYRKFYRLLPSYMTQELEFNSIPQEEIDSMVDGGLMNAVTHDGEVVNLNKEIFPLIKPNQTMEIATVPNPLIDEDQRSVKAHYVIRDTVYSDDDTNTPIVVTYTLVSALRLKSV